MIAGGCESGGGVARQFPLEPLMATELNSLKGISVIYSRPKLGFICYESFGSYNAYVIISIVLGF